MVTCWLLSLVSW